MEKVKLMLSAVLILSVVACTLAFKARKAVLSCLYTHTTSANCPYITKDFNLTRTTVLRDLSTIYVATLVGFVLSCQTTTICTNTCKLEFEQ